VDRPDKVTELSQAWERAAGANLVFPLDDGTGLLQLLRRPDERAFYDDVRLLPGTPTLERYRSQKLIALRDFEIDIELTHRESDRGVLVAHGDQGGGYAVYVDDAGLTFAYNQYGSMRFIVAASPDPGAHVVTVQAATRPGFVWDISLILDGRCLGSMEHCQMLLGFAPFQGIDVGIDRRSPVVWEVFERHGSCPYTGELVAVTYRPGAPAPYDPQHLVDAMLTAGRAGQ
jgi:hypothetical protein